MKKPELLVTAGSPEEVEMYAKAGADAVLVGENEYGLRMPGRMTREEVGEAIRSAHRNGIRAYVSVHNLIDNRRLAGLAEYVREVCGAGADALVFGDPAVLMVMKELGLQTRLHWNAEMTSTSYAAANYWKSRGAVRVVPARELNLEEIHRLKQETDMEVEVQVHGMTNIYHSGRMLIHSYMEHRNVRYPDGGYGPDKGLYLVEHERRNLKLPVYEDENGTHIMSADDICMIENLDELLEEPLDSLKIETLLKPPEYNETVVKVYREAVDAYAADPEHYRFREEWLERIERLQDPDRELTYGFFYKEQVY